VQICYARVLSRAVGSANVGRMADVARFRPHIGASDGPGDDALAALAARQHGVVAYRQLLELGFGRRAIQSRVARGRLHRVHLAVYAVGHSALSGDGRLLAAVLACGPGALLSHWSDAVGEPPATRSELERRFLELCREAGLPRPAVNVVAAGFEVDALWPTQRLVVELDGHAFHGNRAAFERDRVRDAELQLAGYRVLRLTHRRLKDESATVARTVAALLATS
jgi:hypothetical protein